jgi:hypothetical protein
VVRFAAGDRDDGALGVAEPGGGAGAARSRRVQGTFAFWLSRVGPVYYRTLLARQQPGTHYPERIVDAFLRGAAAATDQSLDKTSIR